MKTALTFAFCMMFASLSQAQQGAWTPNALFQLGEANPQQTQIFVSGLSYGLTTYSQQLENEGKPRLFCVPGNGLVMSPMIYDILNAKFSGKKITAKEATVATMSELQKKFPCK